MLSSTSAQMSWRSVLLICALVVDGRKNHLKMNKVLAPGQTASVILGLLIDVINRLSLYGCMACPCGPIFQIQVVVDNDQNGSGNI